MKKVFKIYPALFHLTSNRQTEPVRCQGKRLKNQIDCHRTDGCFLNGDPQTYYGNCQFNNKHTMVSIQFCLNTNSCYSFVNVPEFLFTNLSPKIWRGRNYTLTYIEVSN
jgi:hypothetical protein